ncbi:myosin heavy chain, non-muscle-like isoform X2 [Corticium candelabrum]|uniref:myosin heavy chain, non-muscle-like isoform X2 n=1 Tax=Corticium candelabrum TaxID=121492 RepID=UPI002E273974|nr:myosin heavy chain, non-muscle-like isoform X2 [Corticium candelabrum]
MNEGDIFATLFQTCDEEQRGRVRVSNIIEYLHRTTQPADTSATNLQHLRTLLDPDGSDPEIDYEMYERGISSWVRSLQQERSSPERDRMPDLSALRYSPNPAGDDFLDGQSSILSTHSIEGYGGDTSSRNLDQSELVTTVAEQRGQIQKLMKEKEDLLKQLDVAEETTSQLNEAIAEHKQQLRSYQLEVSRVKQNLNDVQSSKELQNRKVTQLAQKNVDLEQTRALLETTIADSKEQLSQRSTELEALEEANKALTNQLDSLRTRLSGDGDGSSYFLDNSLCSTEELLRLVDELKADKEAAVKDREEVEQELMEIKQENERLNGMLEAQQPMSGVSSASPVFSSTPMKVSSLQHEITGHATGEMADDVSKSHDSLKENYNSLEGDPSLSSSLDHFSLVASQAHAQFRQKHELALQQITELTALDPSRYTRDESVRTELEEDETSFKHKLTQLIASKQNAERKNKKLHSLVSRYKSEKQELIRERNDAVERLEGYVIDAEARSKEIADFKGKLVGEQFRAQNMQREMNDMKRELDQLRDENQSLVVSSEEWNEQRTSLEQRIRGLQSSLQDVEDKHSTVDDSVASLRDENETLKKKQNWDQTRITELEDALELSGQNHGKELYQLWQVLMESGRDRAAPPLDLSYAEQVVTCYQVKELLVQELQLLRSEISRQQSRILDLSDVMPDDNDGSQASVQEAVSCQTDSLLENELMKSAWHDIDHWDIEDTDVRSRPVSPSSSGEMDSSLSMHAKHFEFVLSQYLSEKATLRQRVHQQRQAYQSTDADFRRELEDIQQTVTEYKASAIAKEERELCGKLTTRCDVVKNVVARLSQKAAAHSALKQEERLTSRFETVFRYVKCLQAEVAKVSEELWNGKEEMTSQPSQTSEIGPSTARNEQDLTEATLRLDKLRVDVHKCENDIKALDERANGLAKLSRNGIERSRVRRKSVWLWCQTIIALVILFGLLLFLVLQMFEYRILDGYGASWYGNSVPFVSYHHYGTPPT